MVLKMSKKRLRTKCRSGGSTLTLERDKEPDGATDTDPLLEQDRQRRVYSAGKERTVYLSGLIRTMLR